MIWLQPWIGLGAVAIALPILIHLLGRRRARTERFPTLRFITDTRLQPTRRTRIHDVPLLLLRVAIVLSAVAALAQPHFSGGARRQSYARSLARVIVLDTSASMRRASAAGALMIDSARTLATQLASEATAQLVWPTDDVSRAIDGASAWLAGQPQRAEIVVLSDFQANAPYELALSRVPASTGVRLVRIAPSDAEVESPSVDVRATSSGASLAAARAANAPRDGVVTGANEPRVEIVSRSDVRGTPGALPAIGAHRDGDSVFTEIEWTLRSSRAPQNGASSAPVVRVHVAESESAGATQSLVAANTLSPRLTTGVLDSGRSSESGNPLERGVNVVTSAADERPTLLAESSPIRTPWMVDVVAALQASALLRDAAMTTRATAGSPANDDSALTVVRDAGSRVLVAARQTGESASARLRLLANADASTAEGSATLAALVTATQRALAGTEPLRELEPSMLDDAQLRRWERAPSLALPDGRDSSTRDPLADPSDGRWLWLAVLLLLAGETLLRRNISVMARA